MACKASFELHHNFPKLAEEAGFTFNTHRPRVHIEWSKIKMVDIENIVRNRNFITVEQHLNDILDCVIDLEFDVRILDEGFLKIFRLAQLAVEYQQFCRHYLDRSVFVLREEMASLLQELNSTKAKLKDKDEELRKSKRKTKQSFRNQLPYGNDNIARLILNTLNQNRGDIIPLSTQLDTLNYNKCIHCDKVFLNQLYLQSHLSRRHPDLEVPQKDKDTTLVNSEVNNDIIELKLKLKQMENLILKSNSKEVININTNENTNTKHENTKTTINNNVQKKEVKDAEVSTNNDIQSNEDLRKVELETYKTEINLLRSQIVDIINDKEMNKLAQSENELKMMEQLRITIKSQGDEIISLKQELLNNNARDTEERSKVEAQLSFWARKAEAQSNDFKALLQKLNDVEREAHEYRATAEIEKEKSAELKNLLHQHLNSTQTKQMFRSNKATMISSENMNSHKIAEPEISKSTDEDTMLKSLQQRAQELLNIDNLNSSDSSNTNDSLNSTPREHPKSRLAFETNDHPIKNENYGAKHNSPKLTKNKMCKIVKKKGQNDSASPKKNVAVKKANQSYTPGSPLKIVRAKITEEVNNRLVSLGIDPLKKKLPKSTFSKKRMLLQEQQEIKAKKFPVREQVVHSLISNIDADALKALQSHTGENIHKNSTESSKISRVSSVLSNIRTLSLAKSNQIKENSKKSINGFAKKAKSVLKYSSESYQPEGKQSSKQRHVSDVLRHNYTPRYTSKTTDDAIVSQEKNNDRKHNLSTSVRKVLSTNNICSESSDQEFEFDNSSKQINILNLLKSPVRQPSHVLTTNVKTNDNLNVPIEPYNENNNEKGNVEDGSDDIDFIVGLPPRKSLSEENINNIMKTKGVLKNASSTSSLQKKKVLFDMDAIQMKSVSASPSQSTTERSDNNEQYELGITNLDTEEWDLSSIENLELPEISKEGNKFSATSRQSPKFLQLKQTVESKLMGRNHTLSTTPIGGVDVLSTPLQKGTSLAGSNTSLGSSILDDTENSSLQNQIHKVLKIAQ